MSPTIHGDLSARIAVDSRQLPADGCDLYVKEGGFGYLRAG
jgi:hypothetical protein